MCNLVQYFHSVTPILDSFCMYPAQPLHTLYRKVHMHDNHIHDATLVRQRSSFARGTTAIADSGGAAPEGAAPGGPTPVGHPSKPIYQQVAVGPFILGGGTTISKL